MLNLFFCYQVYCLCVYFQVNDDLAVGFTRLRSGSSSSTNESGIFSDNSNNGGGGGAQQQHGILVKDKRHRSAPACGGGGGGGKSVRFIDDIEPIFEEHPFHDAAANPGRFLVVVIYYHY